MSASHTPLSSPAPVTSLSGWASDAIGILRPIGFLGRFGQDIMAGIPGPYFEYSVHATPRIEEEI